MIKVECPHCGNLFEVSLEVLVNRTELGVCDKCDSMVSAYLTARAVFGKKQKPNCGDRDCFKCNPHRN